MTTELKSAGKDVAAGPGREGWIKAGVLLALALAASLLVLAQDLRYSYLLVYAWFGVGYGILLQYGRFCMASAVRDLFAVGVPRMAVGVLIAVMLYALLAAAVQVAGFNAFAAHPLGWHVLVGGLVFGLGMVFSGGCASSSLYKTGEGNLNAVLVIFAISFSQAWFVSFDGWSNALVPASWNAAAAAQDMPAEVTLTDGWFDQFTAGYLWQLQGDTLAARLGVSGVWAAALVNALLVAILPALLLLGLLYWRNWRGPWRRREKIAAPSLASEARGIAAMFTASRTTAIAGLGLGVLAALHLLVTGELRDYFGIFNAGELLAQLGHTEGLSLQDTVFDPGYWYITTQEAQWAGWALEKLGLEMRDNIFFGLDNGLPAPWLNAPGLMSLGIIGGAALRALVTREFKWKWPNAETAAFAIAGGVLMGIGSRIGMGCNIGAFFATVTNGDISGWVFLVGMVGGGWLGVKAFKAWVDWRARRLGIDF